jgi:hypothetical protein
MALSVSPCWPRSGPTTRWASRAVSSVSVYRKTCGPSALPHPVTEALPGVAFQRLIAHGLHKREAVAGGVQLDLQAPVVPT